MRKGSMELPILEQGQIRSVEKNSILSTDFESGFLGNFRLERLILHFYYLQNKLWIKLVILYCFRKMVSWLYALNIGCTMFAMNICAREALLGFGVLGSRGDFFIRTRL